MKKTPLKKTTRIARTILGKKRFFPVRELPREFVEWNLGQRIAMLEKMRSALEKNETPSRGGASFGAHLPVYITHNPQGSLFPFNAANKGTGFVAKERFLKYYSDKFRSVFEETRIQSGAAQQDIARSALRRIDAILEFYGHPEKIDLRCMAGLEIWPGKTSANFHADPRVALHFLGMASSEKPTKYYQWQLNCVWEKLERDDPRFLFGASLRQLTLGVEGRSFVPGHVPTEHTPTKGAYPFGWLVWVSEAQDKGIDSLPRK